jgi:phosphatidylserine/phosphatidylglycerophosphate/cardiolipin synthase-like enzyme
MKFTLKQVVLLAGVLLATTAAAGTVQVGFSPEGSAQQLVLKTINSAQSSLRMMAYSFTDPAVMKALIAARQRGVDVRIVIDADGNKGKASLAAMNLVTSAGIPLRTDGDFRIQHDKVIIVDNKSVETGSYNYTTSAAKNNSENALLIEDAPELAAQYLTHWEDRWQRGQDWKTAY